MLSPSDLVDISMDFQARRQRFRRRLLRIVIPVGCVLVVIAAILVIATVSYHRNRRNALNLSADLLKTLDRRISAEVSDYLSPASDMVRLAADILNDPTFGIHQRQKLERIALYILKNYPQLAIFSIAGTKGDFLMQKKMPDGSIHTKIIEVENEVRQVTWIRRDSEGNVIKVENDPDDAYDPRVRPWYVGAVEARGLYWTDVYIFFTDQKPGVTASLPVFGETGQLRGVLGLDIELENLSRFLGSLSVGHSGRAFIVDKAGRFVAYPEMNRMLNREGDVLEPLMVDELADPIINRAFNRFRIEGHGTRNLLIDDRRYLSTASSLRKTVGRDWTVFIVVPEDDFIGFITENYYNALMMTGVIVLLAALLAGLLIYQGLRADRNAQLVLERKQDLEAQSRAFSELASKAALFDPDDIESLKELTEIVSATLAVRRASAWGLYDDGKLLKCEDSYDRETNGHTQGTELKYDDFPELFDVLKDGEDIVVSEATNDPRTAKLHRVYLKPLGCDSFLAVPVMPHGQMAGALWFEHEGTNRPWDFADISFARTIAAMLTLRLSASDMQGQVSASEEDPNPAVASEVRTPKEKQTSTQSDLKVPGDEKPAISSQASNHTTGVPRKTSFPERLINRGYRPDGIGADIFEDATVLVLRFTDSLALAEHFGEDKTTTAADHLVCHFEDMVISHGLDYWRIMSDQIICAAGLKNDPNSHAHVIADVALGFHDQCIHLFADLDKPMEVRIGIDTGGVIGSPVGRRQKEYNIWGEAVHAASIMADTGVTGGIHVSEAAYQRLQTNYLFKVRGQYYLQGIGEISTYLLTGRL